MYGSSLETESPRFGRPGDFFTYIAFIELVIVVGFVQSFPSTSFFFSTVFCITVTSAYLPVQFILAETVPGTEEDYPCTFARPIIRNLSKRVCHERRHGGNGIEKTGFNFLVNQAGGFVSLHIFTYFCFFCLASTLIASWHSGKPMLTTS